MLTMLSYVILNMLPISNILQYILCGMSAHNNINFNGLGGLAGRASRNRSSGHFTLTIIPCLPYVDTKINSLFCASVGVIL